MVTETQAPEAPPVDRLAMLEAEAIATEQQAAAAPMVAHQVEEARRAEDTAAGLLEVLQFARSMAEPAMAWWPDFLTVYSDQALGKIAQAGAVVMAKHGWTLGDMLEGWGPYLALIAAMGPPALGTMQAFKMRAIAQQQARQRPPQQQGGAPNGSDQPTAH